MSFYETPRFPENISAGSKFGPGYNTTVARNRGGYEVRNQNWSVALYKGDVSHGVKSQADLDDLLAFFHAMAGKMHGWRFKNWNDYTVTGSQGILTALTATTWQMKKRYTFGAVTRDRPIYKPVSGTTNVTGTGTYTVNTTTGVITKTAGSDPTGFTCEFDTPCRFDTDEMLPEWLDFELYNWSSIPITEIRI